MSSEDISLICALRTRTVCGIRSDIGDMYTSDQCPLCKTEPHQDTSAHEMCLTGTHGSEYSVIFSASVEAQRKAMTMYRALLAEREAQLTKMNP